MPSEKHKTLANDLLKMVDNPQLSDVILVCEDGVVVHACRMVLAARSWFFHQMLLNGMAETREKSISLPTVSSSVLIIVLKFVYAEVLLDEDIQNKKNCRESFGDTQNENTRTKSLRLDWELLLKVVVAVRYLMLEQLEKVIIERLWNDVPKMDFSNLNVLRAHEENAVACNLSILCEYSKLWSENKVKLIDDVFCPHPVRVDSIEVICFHLIQIMAFSELRPATLFRFSKKAFHLYLSKTHRTSSDETSDWSLEEYLRLREVIMWCAVSAAEIEEAIVDLDHECLPGPEKALKFLQQCVESTLADSRSTFDFSEDRESFVQSTFKENLKEDLDKFLKMVDLVSIHPELLVTVIQPLNFIDPLDLSGIYSVQAMRGSRRLRKHAVCQATDVWHWAGSGVYSLRTRSNNNLTFTVSEKPSSAEGISLVSAAEFKMEFSPRMFEWEIVVTPHGYLEHGCMDLLQIGFYRLRHGEILSMKISNDRFRPLAECSRGSVLSISDDEEMFTDKTIWKESSGFVPGPLCPSDGLWNRPVRVTINRGNGTCSFSSDEDELIFTIDNDLDEIFYPVVYISSFLDYDYRPHHDRFTIKIQNLKGFDQPVYVSPTSDDDPTPDDDL